MESINLRQRWTLRKPVQEPRAENNYEIKFTGGEQRSCSVSITDASSAGGSDLESIYSGLLLTADLQEPVYNPTGILWEMIQARKHWTI